MKQKVIDVTASVIAKRIAKFLIIAVFNVIGISSVVGIPIVTIVDIIFLLMLLRTVFGYAVIGGNYLVIISKKLWIFVKYTTLALIMLGILGNLYEVISEKFFDKSPTVQATAPVITPPATVKTVQTMATEITNIASQPLPAQQPTTETASMPASVPAPIIDEPLTDIETGDDLATVDDGVSDELGEVVINQVFHPENEPDGLFVVDFSVSQDINFSYRVYCPTNTVRNISNGEFGISQTVEEADNTMFGGQAVLGQIVGQICH